MQPARSIGGPPDHTAEMRAIALQLQRLSGSVEDGPAEDGSLGHRAAGQAIARGAGGGGDPFEAQDARGTPEIGAGRLDALRDAVAAITRRQADLDAGDRGPGGRDSSPRPAGRADASASAVPPPAPPLPAQPLNAAPFADSRPAGLRAEEPAASTVSPVRPVRSEVPRVTPTQVTATQVSAREPSGLRRAGIDLSSEVSQTFARFSRDLHDAIRATDARPQVAALGHEVRQIGRAVDGLGARSDGSPSSNADALARIGEQTREMRDLLKTSTARSVPFDAVERQVASLEARLGRLAAAPGPAYPDFGDTMAEVRALLDGFNPNAAMAALETRLDAITDRIERGLDARGPAGLIEGLSRRVDEIHAALRAQLAEAAVDTRPLEGLVRGLSERIGQARDASADFHHLESVVRDVGAKIDGAAAGLDARGVQAIEAQLTRLSERLDRSEASLRSLDGVEHTLGELFAQFEVTRQVAIDAAETAARTAARDTLRAALQNPNLAHRSPDGSSAAVDQMARSLDDIRALQDTAGRRTQAALSDIQIAMDRLIGQMAASGSPGRATPADEPRRSRAAADPSHAASAAPDPSDQMIEPGFGRGPASPAGRSEPRFAPEPSGPALPPNADGDGPASFIAAARRAAQAAQASAASTAVKPGDRRGPARPSARRRAAPDGATAGATTGATTANALSRARSFLAQRRRPILLGLAALVLLVGALEVVKLSADPSEASRVGDAPARTRLASSPDASAAPTKAAELPQAVLPSAATPAPAPLPTFVTGQARAPAPADGIPEALRSAAAAGDAAAQYEVGLRYSEGRGAARDPKQAVAWFSKAAASGSAPAEYRLGSAYEKGAGVDRDPALATAWYGKAAEAGNVRAMHNLAVMAADGAGGKPDYARAAQWFGKASTFGVRDSQFNLAILYARGLGIEQSLPQSYTWFAIAAAGGDEDAGKKRDEVAGRLDAKALASAKAAVEAFHAAVPPASANEVAPPPGGWDAAAPRPPAATPPLGAKVSQL